MVIIGVTGSIGMGKSMAVAMLSIMGVPYHDSDRTIHRVTGFDGAAVPAIARAFPELVRDGVLDRKSLADRAFADSRVLKQLELILHPFVRADITAFLRRHARYRTAAVALDVPLLFETGLWTWCDVVTVVSAPGCIQRQRVLGGRGMTKTQMDRVLTHQLPDKVKRRLADFVIPTGLGRALTFRRLAALAKVVRQSPGCKWPPNSYRRAIDARSSPRYRNDRP